ncbi:preprotein translocase subunit SecY [Salegentibacter salinarum]|jgi:preprotein translocase subunit SecY|uniref:Protein translocase subunit SecY n=3 Tax=Salegentibacter TaxID=143222 RepID=A0A1I2LJJ0_9FLAO|nr:MULTISPECIES: preprotein translocase subunit SecY [Salegentibacter]APS37664.1 preprotein translocase subunit SecY [Salegentibacter sp. T436]MBZ9629345.1 preprotein translocase subunit SecY [Salegentibacter lacus]PKD16524.1 preprotein translocase subunit SecY [Salegentibacter salinarum]PRX45257.1 protein translocase subunit secY/sec61 alpha [Salegentibacter salegens]SFF79435.1 protein translocase subunit secY/sec61 alpha [Salegentibacter agarivorans]|tara:strand:+ start:487 stop:1824 length:1338 start_codon:yes stop_codon:yes gene_type:complete
MKFINTIKNIWKIEELKNRILVTLGLLLVYRFGAQVVLPGIDASQLSNLASQTDGGLLGLLNAFTGGAFSNASVFALGIMPYISASIVVQLMGIAIPYLQKLQKEGESGRRKINQITRWLTIAITLVQGPGYIYNLFATLPQQAFLLGDTVTFVASAVVILTTGTIFAMWLGEKITDKGIGNGISLLIMVGIIATLPQAFIQEFASRVFESNGGLIMILIELVIWFAIILASVMLVMAVRQIPVQYARRTASGGYEKNVFGSRQYIPLKLNASGVMPIIFAQAIMFIPAAVAGLSDSDAAQGVTAAFSDIFGFWYNVVFALLIIVFTYFYTAITVPTNKMADDLKRSGGFIPGIRPGTETAEFLDRIMSQITLPGSIFLALIAVFPAIVVQLLGVQQGWALFFGGTSLLIMVGVAIDTMQQVNSYLLNRHYDGLMKTGKNRKAVA